MLSRAVSALLWAAAVLPSAAAGYPDGAPWGTANPTAQENCASCHFSSEAVYASAALIIEKVPTQVESGATYEFILSLADPEMSIAGFQIVVDAGTGASGEFSSTDDDVEYIGGAIRSTKPRSSDAGVVRWRITWNAPKQIDGPITLYSAAAAANEDESPLDDTIHYRQYDLTALGSQ